MLLSVTGFPPSLKRSNTPLCVCVCVCMHILLSLSLQMTVIRDFGRMYICTVNSKEWMSVREQSWVVLEQGVRITLQKEDHKLSHRLVWNSNNNIKWHCYIFFFLHLLVFWLVLYAERTGRLSVKICSDFRIFPFTRIQSVSQVRLTHFIITSKVIQFRKKLRGGRKNFCLVIQK